MEQKIYDRTYVEIDLDAVRHNISEERRRVGSDVMIMAVIHVPIHEGGGSHGILGYPIRTQRC